MVVAGKGRGELRQRAEAHERSAGAHTLAVVLLKNDAAGRASVTVETTWGAATGDDAGMAIGDEAATGAAATGDEAATGAAATGDEAGVVATGAEAAATGAATGDETATGAATGDEAATGAVMGADEGDALEGAVDLQQFRRVCNSASKKQRARVWRAVMAVGFSLI